MASVQVTLNQTILLLPGTPCHCQTPSSSLSTNPIANLTLVVVVSISVELQNYIKVFLNCCENKALLTVPKILCNAIILPLALDDCKSVKIWNKSGSSSSRKRNLLSSLPGIRIPSHPHWDKMERGILLLGIDK